MNGSWLAFVILAACTCSTAFADRFSARFELVDSVGIAIKSHRVPNALECSSDLQIHNDVQPCDVLVIQRIDLSADASELFIDGALVDQNQDLNAIFQGRLDAERLVTVQEISLVMQ